MSAVMTQDPPNTSKIIAAAKDTIASAKADLERLCVADQQMKVAIAGATKCLQESVALLTDLSRPDTSQS